MSHDECVARQRVKAATIASRVLNEEVSMLEAAGEIVGLRDELEVDGMDDDISALVLIVSEADALPLGGLRRLWNKEVLAEKTVNLIGAVTQFRVVQSNAIL